MAGEEATELNVTLYRRGVSRPTTARPWLVEVVRTEPEQTTDETLMPILSPPEVDATTTPSSDPVLTISPRHEAFDPVIYEDARDSQTDDYYPSTPQTGAVMSGSALAGPDRTLHVFLAFCTLLLYWKWSV